MSPRPSGSNVLWKIIAIMLFLIYFLYNTKKVYKYEILQVTPAQLSFEVLNERNPVVLRKGNKNPMDVIQDAMRYTYLYIERESIITDQTFVEVISRYVVIQARIPTEMEIIHPGYVGSEHYRSVSIKLDSKTLLILPTFWAYKAVEKGDVGDVFLVHDAFSAVRSRLVSRPQTGRSNTFIE